MKPPLRLVVDTNVVLSALLWEGKPAELLDLGATDGVRLFTSQALLDELERSLAKPRLAARLSAIGLTAAQHAANYASLTTLIDPAPLHDPVSRDRDDDHVLACALAAGAAAVVTGDDDLLVLGAYRGIAMLRVSECLAVTAAWLATCGIGKRPVQVKKTRCIAAIAAPRALHTHRQCSALSVRVEANPGSDERAVRQIWGRGQAQPSRRSGWIGTVSLFA